MAFCVIKLSRGGRTFLAVLFTIISFILTAISFTLVVYGSYITFTIAPNLHSEKAVIMLIFTVIIMNGMQLTIYYIVGIKVCRKCHFEAYKKHSRYLLRIWMFAGYSSVINVLVVAAMAAGVSNHIIRSMHHSMERGIRLYLRDIKWKKVIDALQYRLKCCGSYSYKDWHRIPWMSIHQFTSDIKKKYRSSGENLYVPVTPFSCCRVDFPTQCFHDPIQQYKAVSVWENPNELALPTIYQIGCVEVLRTPIENGLAKIMLTMISRILYTSYRNAVILGDPLGIAPGWLFGRGDLGYDDGSNISEIINEKSKENIKSSADIKIPSEILLDTNDSNVKHTKTPSKVDRKTSPKKQKHKTKVKDKKRERFNEISKHEEEKERHKNRDRNERTLDRDRHKGRDINKSDRHKAKERHRSERKYEKEKKQKGSPRKEKNKNTMSPRKSIKERPIIQKSKKMLKQLVKKLSGEDLPPDSDESVKYTRCACGHEYSDDEIDTDDEKKLLLR